MRPSSLPKSDSKFWKNAKKYSQESKPEKCEHFFVRKSGSEVSCKKCNIGWTMDGKIKVEEGKLVI